MDIEQIVSVLVNNGAAIGCLIYFMVYNSKEQEKTQEILNNLEKSINELTVIVKLLSEEITK